MIEGGDNSGEACKQFGSAILHDGCQTGFEIISADLPFIKYHSITVILLRPGSSKIDICRMLVFLGIGL